MAGLETAAGLPSPASQLAVRQVVLHADDLGMNSAVTDGILRGFEDGLLTSTSLLSNAPDAQRALDCWRQLESRRGQGDLPSIVRRQRLHDPVLPFDLGIHLNLTQGRPLIGDHYPAEMLDRDGCFPGVFGLFRRLLRRSHSVAAAIEEELTCQVQFMLDRGQPPSHLNGHQYVEMLPGVGSVVESLLEKFHIPVVRVAMEPSWWPSFTWPDISTSQWLIGGLKKFYAGRFRQKMLGRPVVFADVFFGTMTAGTTSLETIHALLTALHGFRLAEIGLHPAAKPDVVARPAAGWYDPLAGLRPRELELVISMELEELLAASGCHLGRLCPHPSRTRKVREANPRGNGGLRTEPNP